jgi:hypothetical protein
MKQEASMGDTKSSTPKTNSAEYNRAYYLANRDAIRAKRKSHRLQNGDAIRLRAKAYREQNAEVLRARRASNAEALRQKCREYYAANREMGKARAQRWREANHERMSATAAEYRKKHPAKCREYYLANKSQRNRWHAGWQKARKEANPNYAVQCKVYQWTSRAMRKHLAGRLVTASSTIVQLLGCEWLEFIAHIESQFQPGMTWENHGVRGWHFDHIRPLSSFDLTNEDELRKGCHYTNVQPLWAADNIRKAGKIA